MRIRKNAARVVDGKKRSSSSYLICQLNRPPWHDDSFFTQGYWDNDLPLHGTSSCNASPPASHSLNGEESMDISFECVSERENGGGGDDGGIRGGNDCPVLLLTMGSSEPEPLDMVLPTPATTVLPKKRGRPRKSTSGASAGNNSNTANCNSNNKGSNNNQDDNPYQFYYYSGFGPSWSKRRGESKFNSVPQLDNGNGNGNGNVYNGSGNGNSDENRMEDDENKDPLNKSDNSNGHVIESFKSVIDAQRELDYIEDEDDEEEWYGGGRARKPIKARSLKSLM